VRGACAMRVVVPMAAVPVPPPSSSRSSMASSMEAAVRRRGGWRGGRGCGCAVRAAGWDGVVVDAAVVVCDVASSYTSSLTSSMSSSGGMGALSATSIRDAVFDGHSFWWSAASPLFAFSVAPDLLILKRLNDAESSTNEMNQAFATLLLFVIVSIPAEAYTKSAYGEVLSNIDAFHFLIQSAISLTNLRILLAFRDERAVRRGNERASATTTTTTTTTTTARVVQAPLVGRPGRVVEAFAGVGLLATSLLLSLDERLLIVPDTAPVVLHTAVDAFRSWGDEFESASSAFLGLPRPAANALSVPTWGVHIFSLVEWLLAMGLVWDYAERDRGNNRGWRTLTWGMLPLHASGICAITQHFFGNVSSLDWLVAAQGAFTMMGNVGMCVAAGELAGVGRERNEDDDRLAALLATSSQSIDELVVDEGETSWWDFDVENFGTKLWAEDNDGIFITKVALLSLAVASGVRGLSLYLSPWFDPTEGALRDYTNIVAFAMVATPLALNVEKWQNRERRVLARDALTAVYASVDDDIAVVAVEDSKA